MKQNVCSYKLTYYLANDGYCGVIYSILVFFYFVKKLYNAVKVFLAISWKLQVFLLFFSSFATTIYSSAKEFILSFSPIKCC